MTSMTPDSVTVTLFYAVFGFDSMHINPAGFVWTRMEVSDIGGSQVCLYTSIFGVFGISFSVSSNTVYTILLSNDASMANGFQWCVQYIFRLVRSPVQISRQNTILRVPTRKHSLQHQTIRGLVGILCVHGEF